MTQQGHPPSSPSPSPSEFHPKESAASPEIIPMQVQQRQEELKEEITGDLTQLSASITATIPPEQRKNIKNPFEEQKEGKQ